MAFNALVISSGGESDRQIESTTCRADSTIRLASAGISITMVLASVSMPVQRHKGPRSYGVENPINETVPQLAQALLCIFGAPSGKCGGGAEANAGR